MKNILYFLLLLILTFSCSKEEGYIEINDEVIEVGIRGTKVTICHATGSENNPWITIDVNENALSGHLAHGDINPDADGDGFTVENSCGIGEQTDCDDNDASINPDAEEISCDGIDNNCDGIATECFCICDFIPFIIQVVYVEDFNVPGLDATVILWINDGVLAQSQVLFNFNNPGAWECTTFFDRNGDLSNNNGGNNSIYSDGASMCLEIAQNLFNEQNGFSGSKTIGNLESQNNNEPLLIPEAQ